VLLCDLPNALTLAAIMVDGGVIELQRLAADVLAIHARSPHAGAHSLASQAALQANDGGGEERNRAALRAAGVDFFAKGAEVDVQPVEFVEYLQKVAGRAADAVAGPNHDDIEAATAGVSQQLFECQALGLCA
jgi:hypothetical protein